MISYFDSPIALFTQAKISGTDGTNRSAQNDWQGSSSWSGPTPADLESLINKGGDESHVPQATRLMEKLETMLPETERQEFLPCVAGAYPCVPDAIQGLPESMRRRHTVLSDGAPIKLGIILTVSAACNGEAILNRGLAMLAIMLQLTAAGRAVELYAINILGCPDDANDESVIATRIGNNGIVSISEADMTLCNIGFCRRLPFTVQSGLHHSNGSWPGGFDYEDGGKAYAAGLAKRLGFKMILPALTAHEQTNVLRDPAKWMLDKYTAIQTAIDSEA